MRLSFFIIFVFLIPSLLSCRSEVPSLNDGEMEINIADRDFIRGTKATLFMSNIGNPSSVKEVKYYLSGKEIGTSNHFPFQLKFNSREFEDGIYELDAEVIYSVEEQVAVVRRQVGLHNVITRLDSNTAFFERWVWLIDREGNPISEPMDVTSAQTYFFPDDCHEEMVQFVIYSWPVLEGNTGSYKLISTDVLCSQPPFIYFPAPEEKELPALRFAESGLPHWVVKVPLAPQNLEGEAQFDLQFNNGEWPVSVKQTETESHMIYEVSFLQEPGNELFDLNVFRKQRSSGKSGAGKYWRLSDVKTLPNQSQWFVLEEEKGMSSSGNITKSNVPIAYVRQDGLHFMGGNMEGSEELGSRKEVFQESEQVRAYEWWDSFEQKEDFQKSIIMLHNGLQYIYELSPPPAQLPNHHWESIQFNTRINGVSWNLNGEQVDFLRGRASMQISPNEARSLSIVIALDGDNTGSFDLRFPSVIQEDFQIDFKSLKYCYFWKVLASKEQIVDNNWYRIDDLVVKSMLIQE